MESVLEKKLLSDNIQGPNVISATQYSHFMLELTWLSNTQLTSNSSIPILKPIMPIPPRRPKMMSLSAKERNLLHVLSFRPTTSINIDFDVCLLFFLLGIQFLARARYYTNNRYTVRYCINMKPPDRLIGGASELIDKQYLCSNPLLTPTKLPSFNLYTRHSLRKYVPHFGR